MDLASFLPVVRFESSNVNAQTGLWGKFCQAGFQGYFLVFGKMILSDIEVMGYFIFQAG